MPSLTITFATPADIPAIIDIHNATWNNTYNTILSQDQIEYMSKKFYSEAALATSMNEEGHQFLILCSDGSPSGFASFSELKPAYFKLHKLYVLPTCQGTGAGKCLITAVENYVKEKGALKICLNVNRYNNARHFYEKMAYRIVREEDIPVGPYWMNDFVLEKALL